MFGIKYSYISLKSPQKFVLVTFTRTMYWGSQEAEKIFIVDLLNHEINPNGKGNQRATKVPVLNPAQGHHDIKVWACS